MYQRESLGLEEAKIAIEAMLKEASKEPNRPVGIAVVDSQGQLIYFARMDGGLPINQEMAIKKAYTAVQVGIDTSIFGKALPTMKMAIADFCSGQLTTVPGGVCVRKTDSGIVLGGIGASGLMAQEDEQLARVGLSALKL
jgi:glc operon protein GlcG